MVNVDGLDGRIAVVTGAARGIGRHIVASLAANGARVASVDLDKPEYDEVIGYQCDVADADSVGATFSAIETELGSPSVLVLNAGIFPVASLEETSVCVWERTLATNLTGAFLCARRALPGMRKSRYGRILSISSTAGKTGGTKDVAAYAASKGGVMALTKAISTEYSSFGVTANALAPAFIETDMISDRREFARDIPVGRLGQPEEVAELAVFLCSAAAAFITGEVVDINGGFHID